MARIRSIKPSISQDLKLAGLSRDARLTFVYLISQADDQGLMPAESRQLLGALYPHDKDVSWRKLSRWLDELANAELIAWHQTVDGMAVLRLVGWAKHQVVKNPGKPVLWGQLADPPSDKPATATANPSGKAPARQTKTSAHSPPTRRRSSGDSTEDVVRLSVDSGGAEGEGEGEREEGGGRGKGEEPAPDGAIAADADSPGPPPPAKSWPGRLAQVWTDHVGLVDPGHIGRFLKPFVDRHGEELVAKAIRHYGASLLDEGRLRFASPKDFARTAAQWLDDARPIGERDFGEGTR